jgi:hypothetical protein
MTDEPQETDAGQDSADGGDVQQVKIKRGVNKVVLVAGILLLAVAAGGVFAVFEFIKGERQRDFQSWQVRLGIVADSRAEAVEEWIDDEFAVMRELAENASLQLYMTELALFEGDRSLIDDEPEQATYLRNLLIATADRSGYAAPVSAGDISANVEKTGVAGLA